jgi:hypothetical protein
MVKNILKNYITNIHEVFSRGDAREESFYTALAKMGVRYFMHQPYGQIPNSKQK